MIAAYRQLEFERRIIWSVGGLTQPMVPFVGVSICCVNADRDTHWNLKQERSLQSIYVLMKRIIWGTAAY